MLKKLPVVGKLVDNELPVFNEQTSFHKTIRENVYKRLSAAKLDSKNKPIVWLTYFAIMSSIVIFYYQQFFGSISHSTSLQMLFALIYGFSCAQLCLHTIHDASHFSVSHNPLIWKILGYTHDFVNGASFLVWNYQHVIGHHSYTNIVGADPDISVTKRDFRRILNFQPFYWLYKYQHFYAPMLYCFLAAKTRVQDVVIVYFTKMNGNIPVNPLTFEQHLIFWSGKIFYFLHRLILPFYLGFPLMNVIIMMILSDCVISYWLGFTFQANHVVEDVELPIKSIDMDTDWAVMQVSATLDYGIKSPLTRFAVGSLNFQTVHHLFPNILQHHYPLIQDIVQNTCEENGIKYNAKDNLADAVTAHLQHLKNLGQDLEKEKNI